MSAQLKTHDEWMSLGYHVMRGQHSEHKNRHGQWLFRPDQVEKNYEWDSEDWEYDNEYLDF